MPERDDGLQAQISALVLQVQQLRDAKSTSQSAPLPASSQSPARPEASSISVAQAPAAVDPEEQQRRIEEHAQQHFATLARGFDAEPTDAQWSQSAQQALLGAYQGDAFEGARIDASCKTTFCRLKADLSGVGQPLVAARMLSMRVPWRGASQFRIDTVNHQVEYYVAREEYELPTSD